MLGPSSDIENLVSHSYTEQRGKKRRKRKMKSEREYRWRSFRRPKDSEMTSKIEHLKTSLWQLEDKQDKLLHKIEKRIEKRNKARGERVMDRSYTHEPPWIWKEDILKRPQPPVDYNTREAWDSVEKSSELDWSNLSLKNRETEQRLKQEEIRLA